MTRWLPIPGWEGLYDVSDEGQVRSHDRLVFVNRRDSPRHKLQKGRVLRQDVCRNGRLRVILADGDRRERMLVHRLVLLAFVGQCPTDMECCHYNDDPADNRLENLRWDTRSANQHDVVRNGNNSEANRTHCPQGHTYDDVNTYFRPDRYGRICKTCRARASAEAALRRAARRVPV